MVFILNRKYWFRCAVVRFSVPAILLYFFFAVALCATFAELYYMRHTPTYTINRLGGFWAVRIIVILLHLMYRYIGLYISSSDQFFLNGKSDIKRKYLFEIIR